MVEAADLPVETGVLIFERGAGQPGGEGRPARRRCSRFVVSGMPMAVGGDVVIAIDGLEVKRFDDLVNYLASYTSVGDVVTLTVVRDGEQIWRST